MKSVLLFGTGFSIAATLIAGSAIGQGSSSPFSGHNSNAPLSWSADRIEVQDGANRVVLNGGVVAQQAELTLTATRVTIAYSKGGGAGISVDRLDASGGVVFKRSGDVARGDFAVYDLQRKIITLVGNVTLTQARGTVRGGRLLIDLNSNRGTLNGGGAAGPDGTTAPGGRVSGTFEVSGKN